MNNKKLKEDAEKLLNKIEDKPQYALADWMNGITTIAVGMVTLEVLFNGMNPILKEEMKKKENGSEQDNRRND